jgi:HlyD family secretion protein
MDIPRPELARKRRIKRIMYGGVGLVLVSSITWALSKLRPAAPDVDRNVLYFGTVKRGPMIREVRGLGILTPVEIQWVPALTEGRVVKRLVLPGTPVKASTVILILSNLQLEQEAGDAEFQLKAAQAQYDALKVQLQTTLLDQRATAATVESDYKTAKLQAEVDKQLADEGLASKLTAELSSTKASSLATRYQIETERLSVYSENAKAQLAAQQAKIDQLRALFGLKKSQVDALHVRAGIDGVMQLLQVDVGQQVTAGFNLARVAQPWKLKAEVKIAETQAKDVQIGQKAEVDTHNGVIPGHVIRIDPSAVNGTRTVDVALDGPLPSGAVPDLSVDGTITLERLSDVLFVDRPAFGQPDSTVSLFKVTADGKEAVRVPVKFGRSSVNSIEIVNGLQVGDTVVLSDMSRWDGFDRIRLAG